MLPAALLLSLAVAPSPQEPPLVELPGGLAITRTEYLEHLYASIGGARLEEALLDRILAQVVPKLPPERIGTRTRAALADPDARVAQAFRDRLRNDFGGDPDAWRRWRADAGLTEAEDRRALALAVTREDRLCAVVQARREPNEANLARVFDAHYGVDGVRASVRHLFLSFGRVRHELETRRAGARATDAEVERIVRERAEALAARLAAGAELTALIAEASDAPDARDPEPGLIPDYDFRRFGSEFAAAVRALEPGRTGAPFRSTHGWHLVRLEARTVTRREDVAARLPELLREEPPTLGERERTITALLQEHGATRPLRR